MCAFSVRASIKAERDERFGAYAAVAIVNKQAGDFTTAAAPPGLVDEELIARFADPKYISDYYIFSERLAGSDALKSFFVYDSSKHAAYAACIAVQAAPENSFNLPFNLIAYSDIAKSTHFKFGERRITQGRFAQNSKECNIAFPCLTCRQQAETTNASAAFRRSLTAYVKRKCSISAGLARFNGLSVGDGIELYYYNNLYDLLNGCNRQYIKFAIAGLYDDNTAEACMELDSVTAKRTGVTEKSQSEIGRQLETANALYAQGEIDELGLRLMKESAQNKMAETYTSAGYFNISRNQVLTVSPVPFGTGPNNVGAYNVGVLYADGQESVAEYAEEHSKTLPEGLVLLDTADMYRAVRLLFKKTEGVFTAALIITGALGAFFSALIILFALKDRAYDIGVLRTMCLPRVKTAVFITGEILAVFAAAYAAAGCMYIKMFPAVAGCIYKTQGNMLITDLFLNNTARVTSDGSILFSARDARYFAFADTRSVISAAAAAAVFAALTGLLAALFIARHEPMKTMTQP